MPVTPHENNTYGEFVRKMAVELGVFDLKGQEIVWHYTNGEGFLGILQSSTLFAAQVAALNDSKETEYATDLFKQAVRQVIAEKSADNDAVTFLNAVLEFVKEEPENPTRGISKFFVTCFSADGDDVNQWAKYAKGKRLRDWVFASKLEPRAQQYPISSGLRQNQAGECRQDDSRGNAPLLQGGTEPGANERP
jgi:hypothetical protein